MPTGERSSGLSSNRRQSLGDSPTVFPSRETAGAFTNFPWSDWLEKSIFRDRVAMLVHQLVVCPCRRRNNQYRQNGSRYFIKTPKTSYFDAVLSELREDQAAKSGPFLLTGTGVINGIKNDAKSLKNNTL